MGEEKRVFDRPELKFIHLCERFWYQSETGVHDILGCFDRMGVVLGPEVDRLTYRFNSRNFFIVLGISGIKLPEACKVEITHINSGVKEFESSQFISKPDPTTTALIGFVLRGVVFTGMGHRSVDVMMGRQLIGGTKFKVAAVESVASGDV